MRKTLKNIQVNVSPDKMKAFIIIGSSDDNNEFPSLEELVDFLNENGITYGINVELLNIIINQRLFNQELLVAEGTYPVDGTDGSLELFFNVKKDRKPVVLEDGKVDFRNLNLLESVKKGQKLCKAIPPLPGEEGKTVTGEVIAPKEGKPVKLPMGRNIEITEESDILIASIDGQVSYLNGRINVYPLYEVSCDVDNSTGNIEFVGNVIIRGNVLSGFQVEAGGNIEIWGVVEGATIKAGGNILIRRGVQGNGKAFIISEGDIVTKYIEHSNVDAKNDIRAEAIMHSTVKCGRKLELSGRKGLLVGGNIQAGKEIEAKVIGSQMATFTEIEVGVSTALHKTFTSLKEEITKLQNGLKKTTQVINLLEKYKASNMLTDDKKEILAKSLKTKQFYASRIPQLKYELNVVEEQLNKESNGKIICHGVIYPGTTITIGSTTYNVKKDLHYCTLYKDGTDIKVNPLR